MQKQAKTLKEMMEAYFAYSRGAFDLLLMLVIHFQVGVYFIRLNIASLLV